MDLSQTSKDVLRPLCDRLSEAGFELHTLADRDGPETREEFYQAYCEFDQDTPHVADFGLFDREGFEASIYKGAWFRPDGAFIVRDQGRIVGLTLGGSPSQGSLAKAQVDFTGVARTHRGRSLGSGLKAAFALWALEQGFQKVVTYNDSRNEAILAANARVGFRVIRRETELEMDVNSVRERRAPSS